MKTISCGVLVALLCAESGALLASRPRTPRRTAPRTQQGSKSSSSRLSAFQGGEASESISDLDLGVTMDFATHASMAEIAANDWDACLEASGGCPFLEHSWLHALEASKCVSPQTGWVPQHVEIRLDGEIAGYMPLYLKGHSMGEFIFDNAWAEAAHDNGIDYYPKLLVGIPFTPVTGTRILWSPKVYQTYDQGMIQKLRKAVGIFLRQSVSRNSLSSVHFNFVTDEEATDLSQSLETDTSSGSGPLRGLLGRLQGGKDDFLRRTSLQYHWYNRDKQGRPFETFDDYLSCFKSKKRINIKRERRKVLEAGVRIDVVRGRDILKYPGLVDRMFRIYQSTIEKMSFWGRQYLSLEFFHMIADSSFVENLCFMCARYQTSDDDELRAEDVFAGTFNIVKDGVFYGRYWGCLPEYDVKNLHFETCYWSAIEYCIQSGLTRMEPGAGGGDYKWARGFNPALIHSVHYIRHPGLRRAVSQFLDYETEQNTALTEYLLERSAVGTARA